MTAEDQKLKCPTHATHKKYCDPEFGYIDPYCPLHADPAPAAQPREFKVSKERVGLHIGAGANMPEICRVTVDDIVYVPKSELEAAQARIAELEAEINHIKTTWSEQEIQNAKDWAKIKSETLFSQTETLCDELAAALEWFKDADTYYSNNKGKLVQPAQSALASYRKFKDGGAK